MNYSNNYLSQVIFRVDFNIDGLKSIIPTDLKAKCEEVSGVKLVEQVIQSHKMFPNKPVESEKSKSWLFQGKSFIIRIQDDSFQLNSTKYTNHEAFHDIIIDIFSIIDKEYSPTILKYAFRYVNNLVFSTGDTYDFDDYINGALLNPTKEFKEIGLCRSIGNMVIKDDNVMTNFIYGFINSEFPNKIAKREFILDYDCSIREITGIEESISSVLTKLRKNANRLFEKSILEPLREDMNSLKK